MVILMVTLINKQNLFGGVSMNKLLAWLLLCLSWFAVATAQAALTVPTDIQQPGTQPGEVNNLESPDKCDNCHGGYNTSVEPAFNWRGSMMAHAGRDPIFWATMAVAEQDFDGAGDLCIRCHSTAGWLGGRSTPTDGSGLAAGDSDGVECDFCHKLTNPDNSDLQLQGVMNPGFIANEPNPDDPFDPDNPDGIEGYYGSGMASMWGGGDKLGPYNDAGAKHRFMHSQFHRSVDFCGSCHDVSNPAVGNLAPNHGTQPTADAVNTSSTNPGNSPDVRVAFNNPPYKYGIVERTFSEYKSALISQTLVSDYPSLPSDLKGGALEAVYNAASQNGTISPDYQNPPAPRFFSCQTCHMRPVTGKGANKSGIPVRTDLPLHDMTGGNYWMADAIQYLDDQGKLLLGGGLTAGQIAAMEAGKLRAREQLELAASLSVNGNKVKIVNHTGHKLISGYPEGRRMWLNIEWYDANGGLIGTDGEYGDLQVDLDGNGTNETTVRTILDLQDHDTKVYHAHMGMTQEWAARLVGLGYDPELALSYDRVTGQPDYTLGELASAPAGTVHETFHFVLNNTVVEDNRIPPFGMSYDDARVRNALPVPANQYGGGGPGSTYNYWDEVTLNPPANATYAEIRLLYQPTSWEYIQFLKLANNGSSAFLGNEGDNMLDAWLNTGMAEPYVMAATTWGTPSGGCTANTPTLLNVTAGNNGEIVTTWQEVTGNVQGYRLYYDQSGKAQLIADKDCDSGTCNTYTDNGLTNGQEYCYKVTAYTPDPDSCESGFSNILCATATQPGQTATVPDVIGLLQADAETAITEAGLVVADQVGSEYSDTVTAGHVISQQPAPDTAVQQGSEVSIVVSLGPMPGVNCADYNNRSSCNAQQACLWDNKNKVCVAK